MKVSTTYNAPPTPSPSKQETNGLILIAVYSLVLALFGTGLSNSISSLIGLLTPNTDAYRFFVYFTLTLSSLAFLAAYEFYRRHGPVSLLAREIERKEEQADIDSISSVV